MRVWLSETAVSAPRGTISRSEVNLRIQIKTARSSCVVPKAPHHRPRRGGECYSDLRRERGRNRKAIGSTDPNRNSHNLSRGSQFDARPLKIDPPAGK